jgi:hypothetical protein
MLLTFLPDFDQHTPHAALTRKPARIVWQQRYEGIAVVAYQGGKAMACISGPWSSKYVLTWWEPMPGGQLEIFDTQEDAMQAVERRIQVYACGRPVEVFIVDGNAPAPERNYSWLTLLLRTFFPGHHRARGVNPEHVHALRRRYLNEGADLTGLSFNASP